jgi:hypothetical protein
MIGPGSDKNNMWISFGSILVFPERAVSKVTFDGNLGLA